MLPRPTDCQSRRPVKRAGKDREIAKHSLAPGIEQTVADGHRGLEIQFRVLGPQVPEPSAFVPELREVFGYFQAGRLGNQAGSGPEGQRQASAEAPDLVSQGADPGGNL